MLVNLVAIAYVISGVLFITALRGLSSPETSRTGNMLGMAGMAIAVIATLFATEIIQNISSRYMDAILVLVAIIIGGIIGAVIAKRIAMTDMPQLVAAFHSLVGLAAVFVAVAAFYDPEAFGIFDNKTNHIHTLSIVELSIGAVVGAITFSGSVIAFAKLQGIMSGSPIVFKGQHLLNLLIGIVIVSGVVYLCLHQDQNLFWAIIALSFLIGFLIIIPIGGADMPVVVSMLNSYSGWAAAGIGFTLQNSALIITGALVGSSGAILSYIMCAAMNRSFISVILGGFGAEASSDNDASSKEQRPVKEGSADDAAFIMKNASSVIIVPGYGMAVAQAQHTVKEMTDALKKHGVKVSFAIHPVAGRMPGHMNVLLAEANVGYDDVFELEDINSEFASADVAFVIGANDVTNPIAKTDPTSPIFGMPILDVEKANTVLFVKRGRGLGYAGVDNELFYRDNTMMLFSDAKKMVEGIVKSL
ncbi:MAG: NAD(P)(+) transhydrogenase (Re/Si-specific) subunit beta [Candidatus Pelagibacterales bacterium]|jgi:NAD(P) transhydrogenase subunit beta|nr:NAD(P)(+) transhydrogenase (Re/Si-specific) subunit beta [Pelagibacterales bacterium]|tara:strand:+ start:1228 stop:2649 length:1422 start_codon:yes stop_codon:yes gene_type:complete